MLEAYQSICIDDLPTMAEIATARVGYPLAWKVKELDEHTGNLLYCIECQDGIVFIYQLPKGKWEKGRE